MRVVANENSHEEKLVVYDNIKHIDFSSGIAILVTDTDNKYLQISDIKTITE